MQTQINSVNNVIESTNAIMETISDILRPLESCHLPYDFRIETLLKEFSMILNKKIK